MDGLQRTLERGDVIVVGDATIEVLTVGASPRVRIVAPRDVPIVHTSAADGCPHCIDAPAALDLTVV